MTKLTALGLRNETERHIYFNDGYLGFKAGSDAVLAYRGSFKDNENLEEIVCYAIGLARKKGFGIQQATLKAMETFSLRHTIVEVDKSAKFFRLKEMVFRGQGNLPKLAEEGLKIALEQIRQRETGGNCYF